MQISHSKTERYKNCPRSYQLHYEKRIRPTTTTSALWFGSAIGIVLNGICLSKKKECTEEELKEVEDAKNPKDYFDKLTEEIEINGVKESTPHSPNIRYYRKDYNPSILTDGDRAELTEYAEKVGLFLGDRPARIEDFIDEYLSHQIDDTDILSFINLHFYLSLRRKGFMMIDEFMENFFHKIIEVHSIEREIKIDLSLETDPEFTDYLIGYIDMECSYELCRDYDKNILKPFMDLEKENINLASKIDKAAKKDIQDFESGKQMEANLLAMSEMLKPGDIIRITTDFKTASTRYGTKKLTESSQLARYQYCAQNPYHGYFVFVKTLKTPKKGPRTGETFTEIQVLISERDQELENTVLDGDEVVLEKIQNGEFPKIPERNCKMMFGTWCSYLTPEGCILDVIKGLDEAEIPAVLKKNKLTQK